MLFQVASWDNYLDQKRGWKCVRRISRVPTRILSRFYLVARPQIDYPPGVPGGGPAREESARLDLRQTVDNRERGALKKKDKSSEECL